MSLPWREREFAVREIEFAVIDSEFAVRDSEFAVRQSEFAMKDSEFAVRDSEFAVKHSEFAVRERVCRDTCGPPYKSCVAFFSQPLGLKCLKNQFSRTAVASN